MQPFTPALTLCLLAALVGAPQGRGAAKQGRPEKEKKVEAPVADDDLAQKYFEIADYNGNGWLSIAEAGPSLGLDRRGFALFDEDSDGRITLPEFRARYEKIVKAGGAFAVPIGKNGQRASQSPSPSASSSSIDMALRFDADGDGTLDRSELRAFLEDLHSRLETDVVLSNFDRDGSRRLEKGELADLAAFLDPARHSHPKTRVGSIEELFGKSLPREDRIGTTQLLPRIPGPVPVFRRLDLDADGRITSADLLELQRPIEVPVRLAAVLATLDTNGDGVIDAAEFAASMAGN